MAIIPHFDFCSPRTSVCPMFGRDMQENQFLTMDHALCKMKNQFHSMDHALRRTEHTARSHMFMDKDQFRITLDVHQFAPSELTVVLRGYEVIVEGRHEERQDEHGSISRHIVRKFVIPEGHYPDEVVSNLSSDGILTITAPHRPALAKGERAVPIQAVGPAIKPLKEYDAKSL